MVNTIKNYTSINRQSCYVRNHTKSCNCTYLSEPFFLHLYIFQYDVSTLTSLWSNRDSRVQYNSTVAIHRITTVRYHGTGIKNLRGIAHQLQGLSRDDRKLIQSEAVWYNRTVQQMYRQYIQQSFTVPLAFISTTKQYNPHVIFCFSRFAPSSAL